MMEAVGVAQDLLNRELGVGRGGEYRWCGAIIMGSGPKGTWSIRFVGPTGEYPYRDVHVSVPDKKATVGQPYGLGRREWPSHPCTNALAAARARLGPEQNRYYPVAGAYHGDRSNWFFQFQKATPHLCWTTVDSDGNVGNFLETTPPDSTNAIGELLEEFPVDLSSALPYGSEEVSRKALRIFSGGEHSTAMLPVGYWPTGFVTVQSTSLLRDGKCFLLYRVLYDNWPTGIRRQKKLTWQIPVGTAGRQVRIIHRPDRVMDTQPTEGERSQQAPRHVR